jgi:hypothetical protein
MKKGGDLSINALASVCARSAGEPLPQDVRQRVNRQNGNGDASVSAT